MMLRTTLAGLRSHLGRLVATTLAVVFGVAFVAGTLIFTDTAQATYENAYARVAVNVDVSIRPNPAASDPSEPVRLSEADLEAVRARPDVAAAAGRMAGSLALLDRNGRPVTNFGSVGRAVSTDGEPGLLPYEIIGRAAGAGEALLDTDTAQRLGYGIGDQITVVDINGDRHRYAVVGLIDPGVSQQFAGHSVVGLPAAVLTALTGTEGYDEIVVRGRDGVRPEALLASVAAAVGEGPQVVSGEQRRQALVDESASWIRTLGIGLLLFGLVSLVVAAFVIYNTFAVLSALRVRQTALLRCTGATRRQVFDATILESAIVGLVGGGLGIGAGIGVAYGLAALLNSTLDAGIPIGRAVVTPAPVAAGLLLGLVVTVAAAFIPAVRATRTPPVAALRDQVAVTGTRRPVVRLVLAALVVVAGVGATGVGYTTSDGQVAIVTIVLAGLVTFLGVLLAAPVFVGPMSTVVGALPSRLFGTPARLATASSRRNPGRAAITAAPLTIGIGLMTVFSVVMSSTSASVSRAIAEQYPVDFVATSIDFGGDETTIPPSYAQALRGRSEFAAVAQVRSAVVTVDGVGVRIGAIDPAALGTLVTPPITEGSLADLQPGTAIVASGGPRFQDMPLGATLSVTGERSSASLRVVALASILAPGAGNLDALVTWSDLAAIAGEDGDTAVLAKRAAGVSPTAAVAVLDTLADDYPLVSVGNVAALSTDVESILDSLLALIAGLLAITVVIALFGIANTLALSVIERTRESATVRALGLTRGQLRATLVVESLLMAAVGALVGLVFGLVYGWVLARTIPFGVPPVVDVPWAWFAGIVVLTAVTAVLAAVLPARRAAKASIVAAMADT